MARWSVPDEHHRHRHTDCLARRPEEQGWQEGWQVACAPRRAATQCDHGGAVPGSASSAPLPDAWPWLGRLSHPTLPHAAQALVGVLAASRSSPTAEVRPGSGGTCPAGDASCLPDCPSATQGARSRGSEGGKLDVEFVNQSGEPVALMWVGSDGAENLHEKMAAGARMRVSTYRDHVWRACGYLWEAFTRLPGSHASQRVSHDDDGDRPY